MLHAFLVDAEVVSDLEFAEVFGAFHRGFVVEARVQDVCFAWLGFFDQIFADFEVSVLGGYVQSGVAA